MIVLFLFGIIIVLTTFTRLRLPHRRHSPSLCRLTLRQAFAPRGGSSSPHNSGSCGEPHIAIPCNDNYTMLITMWKTC